MSRPLQRCLTHGPYLALALALLLAVVMPAPVAANGGTIRVASVPSGLYTLTVYTSPSPLRPGPVDVSVLVQRAGSTEIVEGARVDVTLFALSAATDTILTFPATREQATNKLFYAAHARLPSTGRWRVETRVDGPLGPGLATFEFDTSGGIDTARLVTLALIAPLPGVLVWLLSRAWRSRRAAQGRAT